MTNDKNITTGRYKTCGYGNPLYDQDGHYDEVSCGLSKEPNYCGDFLCPLDNESSDRKNKNDY